MKSLEVSRPQWVLMTADQRRMKIDKVLKQGVKCSSKSVVQHKAAESTKKMSVTFSNAHVTHLHPSRVADLWKKA